MPGLTAPLAQRRVILKHPEQGAGRCQKERQTVFFGEWGGKKSKNSPEITGFFGSPS